MGNKNDTYKPTCCECGNNAYYKGHDDLGACYCRNCGDRVKKDIDWDCLVEIGEGARIEAEMQARDREIAAKNLRSLPVPRAFEDDIEKGFEGEEIKSFAQKRVDKYRTGKPVLTPVIDSIRAQGKFIAALESNHQIEQAFCQVMLNTEKEITGIKEIIQELRKSFK